jgi:hypothetical protein
LTQPSHLLDLVGSNLRRCSRIHDKLVEAGLFAPGPTGSPPPTSLLQPVTNSWRIAPVPFALSHEQFTWFSSLGSPLLAFYRALNRLYGESVRGTQPAWIARYLDQGKPEALVTYSRMKRLRDQLPAVIRPDIIPTSDGMVVTELDSVPGGIGLTACLSHLYAETDSENLALIGGSDGMIQGFGAMLRHQQGQRSGCVAILVSEEAEDYRPEMRWLAEQLRDRGLDCYCAEPRDIRFTEEGLFLSTGPEERPVGLIYRFFELFDLMNIPKAELVQYAVKKERVAVTPPYKPALEEKLAFALLHHPILSSYWQRELGREVYLQLTTVMPRTWVLDPAPIPPSATIPGLSVGGRAVANWSDLATATQKERQFVIKPSGFSELAWGSRGVSVGHDLSQTEWAAALDSALSSFPQTPYVLQEFHKGRLFDVSYFDPVTGDMQQMAGRARLSPYYFVQGEKVELGGILATICPADKKVIHGMKEAVMVPCALAPDGLQLKDTSVVR